MPEMTEKLRILAEEAAKHDLTLTVDAEESERLNLSLQIFEGVLSERVTRGLGRVWSGDTGLYEIRAACDRSCG